MYVSGMHVAVLALACFAVAGATLLDQLNAVHQNPAFQTLSAPDQLLIVELIAEIESGELKAYIDQVGFATVLSLINRLPNTESHLLQKLLIEELEKETTTADPSTVVGKRDLAQVLATATNNAAFQNLSIADQTFVKAILTAAENNTLTSFIDKEGYLPVLTVLNGLPEAEFHVFDNYLQQHLKAEQHAGR